MNTEFRTWFEDNGGIIHPGISLSNDGGNSRGITWNMVDKIQDFDSADQAELYDHYVDLVRVPWRMVICRDNCLMQDEWLRRFHTSGQEFSRKESDIIIGIFMHHEMNKGPQSFYYPYFQILPDVRLVYEIPNSILVECRDQTFINKCKARKSLVDKLYTETIAVVKKFDDQEPIPSYEEFMTIWKLLCSRGFHGVLRSNDPSSTEIAPCESGTLLCPFADLFNHKNHLGNKISTYSLSPIDSGDYFALSVKKSQLSHGNEVLISYGDERDNSDLLLSYGFCCFSSISPSTVCPFEKILLSLPLLPILARLVSSDVLNDDRIIDVCEHLSTVCGYIVNDTAILSIEGIYLTWNKGGLAKVVEIVESVHNYFYFGGVKVSVNLRELSVWWILEHNLLALIRSPLSSDFNERSVADMMCELNGSIRDDEQRLDSMLEMHDVESNDLKLMLKYRLMRKYLMRDNCANV